MNQNLLQWIRLGIGFGQGIFLFALQQSLVARSGLAINEYVFAALLAAGFFVPLIVIAGLGNLRPRTLIVWTVVASVICCLLASYDIWRADSASLIRVRANTAIPSIWLWLGLAVIIFIIDRLVVAADTDRRWIGHYSTLFNVSWKLGLQTRRRNDAADGAPGGATRLQKSRVHTRHVAPPGAPSPSLRLARAKAQDPGACAPRERNPLPQHRCKRSSDETIP